MKMKMSATTTTLPMGNGRKKMMSDDGTVKAEAFLAGRSKIKMSF